METVWFFLLWLMLATYVVLDGFDLGVGMLHLVVARSDAEREQVLRSVGPVWDGNEVWLLAAGGTMFMSFPVLYAASFSGFYLPLMIVLWLLVARALGIELRHQIHDPLWAQFWDVAFSAASLLLVVCFGAALGNVIRGVPFNAEGEFFEPLWTNFRVGEQTGILDWYTVIVGLAAVAALGLHGALWLAARTDEAVESRAKRLVVPLWTAAAVLSVAATVASFFVQPQLGEGLAARPWTVAFAVVALAGLLGVLAGHLVGRPGAAFLASAAYLYGLIGCAAAGIYPYVLPAREPGLGLTAHAAAAPTPGLIIALGWWIPGMLLVCAYTWLITYRSLPDKFTLEDAPGAGV
ncbi:MAG: cytochrome d ubiquinol oxidase subunit II [Planctomycetota bacterium]|jgi:cytochrome d ubiquinol oxidase subunit II